jgi:hypothetical protein
MPLTVVPKTQQSAFSDTDGATEVVPLINALNYFRETPGTIVSKGKWRIDAQKPTGTEINLQIQRNDANNPSSVAGILVSTQYRLQIPPDGATAQGEKRRARIAELTRVIQRGFAESLKTWKQVKANGPRNCVFTAYRVVGDFSN